MNAEAVQAVMEVMGCVREVDDNGRAYCPVHMFGWLSDVNACPRAERVAEVSVAAAEPHLTREARAEAWDEGFDAGHQAARAVNPEWPEQPTNPYRIEQEVQT